MERATSWSGACQGLRPTHRASRRHGAHCEEQASPEGTFPTRRTRCGTGNCMCNSTRPVGGTTSNHDKPDLLASSWSRRVRHETYGIYRFHCRTCKASACTNTAYQSQLQDIETEAAALHTPLVVSPLDLGSNWSGCWPPSESVEQMLRSQDRRANWQPHAGSMCWISCAAASGPLQFCECTRAVPWRSSVWLGVLLLCCPARCPLSVGP